LDQSRLADDFINRVVESYADTLLRVSFAYLKNRSDAEDVVQEVYLKLMQRRPLFKNQDHEKAWLIRVAVNLCKNRLKTAWFRKTIPLEESIPTATPGESRVMEAVFTLPPQERAIVQLFYFEGYMIKEIAAIIGRKESTTGSLLYRARHKLKTILKEEFDHD